jgi:hypothetical protein
LATAQAISAFAEPPRLEEPRLQYIIKQEEKRRELDGLRPAISSLAAQKMQSFRDAAVTALNVARGVFAQAYMYVAHRLHAKIIRVAAEENAEDDMAIIDLYQDKKQLERGQRSRDVDKDDDVRSFDDYDDA